MKKKVPETVGACFDLIEREMLEGPWVMGADYTIADAYLFTIAQWIGYDGVDIKKFAKVSDHHDRMLARPAVRRALTAEGDWIEG